MDNILFQIVLILCLTCAAWMTQRNLELRAELRMLAMVCDVLHRYAAGEDLGGRH